MAAKKEIMSVLEPTKLPCVRITPEPNAAPGPTDSKFGGDFYLPAGAEAPEMEFLAQINFAQVPHLEGFPDKGLLQFFLCTEKEEFEETLEADGGALSQAEFGIFQVHWYPDVSQDGLSHPDTIPEDRWEMKKIVGGMTFERSEETATLSPGDADILVADMGFEEITEKLVELIYSGENVPSAEEEHQFFADFGNWGCKLGGHPGLRYDDIRPYDPSLRLYTTLLFQFDLTPPNTFAISADTFCFFIKPEDLKARRFDNILLMWHNCY